VNYRYASIGNGLYVATKQKPTWLQQYRAQQKACDHVKRDPHGTCYRCGDQLKTEAK
jgi:hypothetical protein